MLHILLSLIVLGVVLYLVTLIPMDGAILQIIRVVVMLMAIFYVLGAVSIRL